MGSVPHMSESSVDELHVARGICCGMHMRRWNGLSCACNWPSALVAVVSEVHNMQAKLGPRTHRLLWPMLVFVAIIVSLSMSGWPRVDGGVAELQCYLITTARLYPFGSDACTSGPSY
jgi:hypothetical protein